MGGNYISLDRVQAWRKKGSDIGDDQEDLNVPFHLRQNMGTGKAVIRKIQHGDPGPRDRPDCEKDRRRTSRWRDEQTSSSSSRVTGGWRSECKFCSSLRREARGYLF